MVAPLSPLTFGFTRHIRSSQPRPRFTSDDTDDNTAEDELPATLPMPFLKQESHDGEPSLMITVSPTPIAPIPLPEAEHLNSHAPLRATVDWLHDALTQQRIKLTRLHQADPHIAWADITLDGRPFQVYIMAAGEDPTLYSPCLMIESRGGPGPMVNLEMATLPEHFNICELKTDGPFLGYRQGFDTPYLSNQPEWVLKPAIALAWRLHQMVLDHPDNDGNEKFEDTYTPPDQCAAPMPAPTIGLFRSPEDQTGVFTPLPF